MKIWRSLAAVATAAVLTTVAACSSTSPTTAGASDKLSVAAAFYPFEFVAQRVGGDQVEVTSLTPPGAEPHDLELTPQQVAAVGAADLVVFESGFQGAVDSAVEQMQPQRTVDVATFVDMLVLDADGEEHAEDEGDDHGATDPHTWLDPTNMVLIAEHVRDALTEARPEAKQEFSDNTEALISDLTTLDGDITSELTGCRLQTFITSHAAFGYFAERYGLTQVGIRGIEPDVEPTAARIAEVQQLAKDQGVTTIFFETLVSPVVSESIAGDLGLKTDVLDPIAGITSESRGSDYLEVMRANASALKTANQCG